MSISSAQCRAARALIDWSQDQLAENAQVGRATVADFERSVRVPMRQNLLSIRSALEAAGIEFIPDGDDMKEGGAGVRFRKVELEYSRNLRVSGEDIILPVRYRQTAYLVTIPRNILDDIDHTNYRSVDDRVKSVERHLPKFLIAIEGQLAKGHKATSFVLRHADLPDVF